MFRILLVLLAVLVAVLAFVFDQPWLYVAASVPLFGALGLLGWHLWDAYRRQPRGSSPAHSTGDEASESLGVMDVRPQERQGGNNGSSASETTSSPSSSDSEAERPDEAAPSDVATASSSSPSGADSEVEVETAVRTAAQPQPAASEEHPVLGPFLESLRSAIGAETACLLVQEEVVLEYRIEALASTRTDVRYSGTFQTQTPLLTATMSRQPVTVRQLDGADERATLGYYETPPDIQQVAVAPVDQPEAPASVFLLADATAEADLSASRPRALLERFAGTVALLRDTDEQSASSGREASPSDAAADPPTSPSTTEEALSDQPRPRREIIAEEMEAADAGDDELALVLVHLNRAESIARRGEEAVATAEEFLRTRLEHFAPGQRVERFGELTYGIFPRRDVEAVEEWVSDLQEVMHQETGELEGGVSVGVAVRRPRHDPEGLRADATTALQEAYETGTSTILE